MCFFSFLKYCGVWWCFAVMGKLPLCPSEEGMDHELFLWRRDKIRSNEGQRIEEKYQVLTSLGPGGDREDRRMLRIFFFFLQKCSCELPLAKNSCAKPMSLIGHAVAEGVNTCMPPVTMYPNVFEVTWPLPWEKLFIGMAFVYLPW